MRHPLAHWHHHPGTVKNGRVPGDSAMALKYGRPIDTTLDSKTRLRPVEP